MRRKSKYGAIKTTVDGIVFDSKMEARYYTTHVRPLKPADLVVHPSYDIVINDVKVCRVILDFQYTDPISGKFRLIDVKGCDTNVSRLKRKLLRAVHNLEVEVVKG